MLETGGLFLNHFQVIYIHKVLTELNDENHSRLTSKNQQTLITTPWLAALT